jgi:hypothetical protein
MGIRSAPSTSASVSSDAVGLHLGAEVVAAEQSEGDVGEPEAPLRDGGAGWVEK